MKGWEIKPLGWIVLIALVGIAFYKGFKWLYFQPRNRKQRLNPEK